MNASLLPAAWSGRRVSLTQFDLDQIINPCVRFSCALSGVVSIVEDHDDYPESNGDSGRTARGWNFAGDGAERPADGRRVPGGWRRCRWRLVSGLWVRLWVRRSSAVR